MKKIVLLSLVALCMCGSLIAQSVDDDLYYTPSKKDVKNKVQVKETASASTKGTVVVVKDRKGNTRDVDEYNRRYSSSDYNFAQENDTLYIEERIDDGLDGEWIGGFDGSEDDFEYATRIIRFRNPRYAISISSPLYWDVVYGFNSWDWNVYTDGIYAYAFPTYTNRLWWDWRYDSFAWRWNAPYYGWNAWYGPGWGFHFGWSGGWWGHHHHHHHPAWNPGRPGWGNVVTHRPSYTTTGRRSVGTRTPVRGTEQVRRTTTTTGKRRVVGTRSSSTTTRVNSERTDAASSRRTTYTRPSSTRATSVNKDAQPTNSRRSNVGTSTRNGRNEATYNRGSSTRSNGTSVNTNRTRSTNRDSYNNGGSTRASRSSGGSYSSGSSSRSSSGYSGSGSSRSSSGGSSRSSRR